MPTLGSVNTVTHEIHTRKQGDGLRRTAPDARIYRQIKTVRIMEERLAPGEAAANLMSQFIDTGNVRDEGQGKFTL